MIWDGTRSSRTSPLAAPCGSALMRGNRPIEDDGGANVDCYNDHLESLKGENDTWFTAAWLFAECYLYVSSPNPSFPLSRLCPLRILTYSFSRIVLRRYRLIRTLFARTTHWANYDPFFTSKEETYKSSSTAMIRKSPFRNLEAR
jgi:hypothetical protein